MPYWLETDAFADDPRWPALAGGRADLVDQLQAAYCRLKAKASLARSNGYLVAEHALAQCRGRRRTLELLCTQILDLDPLVHRKGDVCACLGDDWVDGYAYRIHEFLKRNPSRAENDRNRAQRADLRDARLKGLVYERDGGCCRYCRSGPLSAKAGRSRDRRRVLTFDHVDPDRPAGADGGNLVVACGACNEHKGHRTPAEAEMTLLEAPTPAQAAAWASRGLAVFPRPDTAAGSPTEQPPITDETATEHCSVADPNSDPVTDRTADRTADPHPDSTGSVRPENGDHQHEQPPVPPVGGVGSGRVGSRADPAVPDRPAQAAQPPRTPDAPDIYHRRSRASPAYEGWPPGSVPASPPRPAPEGHPP